MFQTNGTNIWLIQRKGGSRFCQNIQLKKYILKLLASFKIQIKNILIKLFFNQRETEVSFISCYIVSSCANGSWSSSIFSDQ